MFGRRLFRDGGRGSGWQRRRGRERGRVWRQTITLPNTSAKLRVGQPFAGVIDEIAIYDRVLSDAEIADHYAIGKGN